MKRNSSLVCTLFVTLWVLAFLASPAAKESSAASTRKSDPRQGAVAKAKPEDSGSLAVLRLALDAAGPGNLNPHFAAAKQDRLIADMVFNGLVRYAPGNASVIEPDLAESLPSSEIVDGKQIWTFKLRREVMFHPGPKTTAYVLTADDVVYSLYKSADPTHSAYAGEFGGMTFARVDDYTVRIILEKPLSSILFLPRVANYAGGFIVSRKAVEAMGQEAFNSHPVGTGPFIFDSWTPEKKIRLVANRRYFRGSPLVDAVEVCYLPDIGSRERGLRAGQLDVIEGPQTTAWVKKMEQEQDIHVDVFGVGEVETIHFNATVQPLDDVRARRAIAHALDRKELLALLGERICGSVYSPVPSQFLPGGLTEHEVKALGLDYAPDLEKARQLLAEAGHPRGFSLEVSTSAMDAYLKSSECIKAQLARIGIDLKLKVVDHSTMHKMIRRDVNPLVIYIAWRPNADAFLTRFFHSDSIVVTGPKPDTNFSHYDKIDRLIEAGRLEINSSKQIELWKHAQIKVLEDLVAYPLLYINLVYARRAGVDYGHELISSMALYPQITEKTRMVP